MASFGTLALLLAFGLLAGPDGGYAFASMRGHHPDSVTGALVVASFPAAARRRARSNH